MNNNNIVKIGTALKWRSTFDIEKRYYQENIVTMCGCVFRCKILLSQGKSPVYVKDEAGHIAYANPDVWDVIVDMANYYNFVIDCKYLVEQTHSQVQQNAHQIQVHQQEIDAIKQEDVLQWLAIDSFASDLQKQIDDIVGDSATNLAAIEEYIKQHQTEHLLLDEEIEKLIASIERIDATDRIQQEQIAYLLGLKTVYTSGYWDNDVLWLNNLCWENGPSSDSGCTDCDAKFEKLEKELADLTIKYNEQQTIINKQQQQIEQLLGALISSAIKSYDSETGTIYFADYVAVDESNDEAETLAFTDSLSVKDYDEETMKVYIV